jgi:hypothetical protein
MDNTGVDIGAEAIESAKYLADISCVVILSNDFADSGGK